MTEPVLYYGIRIPALDTLRKYGFTEIEWKAEVAKEIGVIWYGVLWECPICGRTPPSGRTVMDHYHVKNWKRMPPEERRQYFRGIVCISCNHFILSRYLTPDRAEAAAEYLYTRDPRWKSSAPTAV